MEIEATLLTFRTIFCVFMGLLSETVLKRTITGKMEYMAVASQSSWVPVSTVLRQIRYAQTDALCVHATIPGIHEQPELTSSPPRLLTATIPHTLDTQDLPHHIIHGASHFGNGTEYGSITWAQFVHSLSLSSKWLLLSHNNNYLSVITAINTYIAKRCQCVAKQSTLVLFVGFGYTSTTLKQPAFDSLNPRSIG